MTTNKGIIIKKLLQRHTDLDFCLCVGDDKTDEDMFRAILEECALYPQNPTLLKDWCFTCTIGSGQKKTLAKYHVNTPEQMVSMLMRIGHLMSSERIVGTTI